MKEAGDSPATFYGDYMRAVVQRVKHTELRVDGELISQIPFGLVVFLGVTTGDTEKEGEYIAKKIANAIIKKLIIF